VPSRLHSINPKSTNNKPYNLAIEEENRHDAMSSVITKYPPDPTYKMPGKLARQFIRDPIKTLTNIAGKYGDISYFKLGPKQHVYLINNPDYIERCSYMIIAISKRVRGCKLQKPF
jgi:hypothetical protein